MRNLANMADIADAPPPVRVDRPHLPRAVTIAVVLAGLGFAVTLTQSLASLVAPVFLALNLMIVAHPLHTWLALRRVPRPVAAAVTGLAVWGILVGFLWSIGWALSQLIGTLPSYGSQFNELYANVTTWLAGVGIHQSVIVDDLQRLSPTSVIGFLAPLVANAWALVGLLIILATVLLVMTMDSATIDHRLAGTARSHPEFVTAVRQFADGVRRYWLVSTVFGLICAGLDFLGLWALGVPLALVWGLLVFLANYVPNVGFVLGLIPPALLALLALGPGKALLVVVVYLGINVVVQSGIMPRYTGAAVGITPTLTFLSLLFWAWVLGPLGALLAVPMTILWKALLVDADPDARWINGLIASDADAGHADAGHADAGPAEQPDPPTAEPERPVRPGIHGGPRPHPAVGG